MSAGRSIVVEFFILFRAAMRFLSKRLQAAMAKLCHVAVEHFPELQPFKLKAVEARRPAHVDFLGELIEVGADLVDGAHKISQLPQDLSDGLNFVIAFLRAALERRHGSASLHPPSPRPRRDEGARVKPPGGGAGWVRAARASRGCMGQGACSGSMGGTPWSGAPGGAGTPHWSGIQRAKRLWSGPRAESPGRGMQRGWKSPLPR